MASPGGFVFVGGDQLEGVDADVGMVAIAGDLDANFIRNLDDGLAFLGFVYLVVDRDLHALLLKWGGRRWEGFGGSGDATTTVETYKVGTLVIDLFDAKTEKLIWRGASSDTLSDNADKNTKNLDKGVNKMFQHFPPVLSAKH